MKPLRLILATLALALPAFGEAIESVTFTVINSGTSTIPACTNYDNSRFGAMLQGRSIDGNTQHFGNNYFPGVYPALAQGEAFTFITTNLTSQMPLVQEFKLIYTGGSSISCWYSNPPQSGLWGAITIPGAFFVNPDTEQVTYASHITNFVANGSGVAGVNGFYYPSTGASWMNTNAQFELLHTNSIWYVKPPNSTNIYYTAAALAGPWSLGKAAAGAKAPRFTAIIQDADANNYFLGHPVSGQYWTNPPAAKSPGNRPNLLTLTNDYTLGDPGSAFAAGDRIVYYVTPSGTNQNFSMTNTIRIPSASGITWPKLLTTNKTSIVQIQYSGSFWMLTSMVGEY